ncbi:MAG TPA: redoxin domain-containing protein [Terriglobia bacterium]|nr:redoxin domain-containing protein [Terriglobia bacterium]
MAELGEFVKHDQELRKLDVQVLAISVDPVDKASEARAKLKAPFPMLSDSQDKVMDLYGTRSPVYKGRDGAAINTPTMVLIDKTGRIRWLHQAADYKIRAPISEVLENARKLD